MKNLSVLFFALITITVNAQVKVTGTVKNFNDSLFYITETGGFNNFTRVWRDNKVKVVVNNGKTFAITIPEESIGAWYIKTKNGIQVIHFVKGEDLQLVIDFSLPNPAKAIGKNAGDFNFYVILKDSINKYYAETRFPEKVKHKNIDSVLLYRKQYASYKSGVLNKYRTTHKMSDVYYNWLHAQYSYEPFERTLVENVSNRDSLDNASVLKIMEKGISDEYAALNTAEYNDLVDFYIASTFNKRSDKKTITHRFNYVAEGNVLSGSTKDVYLSRFMAGLIKTPDSIYLPLFQKYDQIVHNAKMKSLVIDRRNDYQTPKNVQASVYGDRVKALSDIFKKYKGKIVYIDFWASWCIPCRSEMPRAAILKEKLKGQAIVFLYFGYNDKEAAWLKARKQLDIQGEHYLLNEAMIKEADELFGINGIPHYAIIDKNGNIVSKRADRPGEIYKELFSLINK
ncbi:MAG: TlpA family protein disulfide reductase [Sediminibacterium sp.]